MPKKNRITIPNAIADKVLFNHNRTCCVCRIQNKEVQIHHIDENPTNNAINNLAVLCLDCHNKTQITGGFGRHLNAGQIILYRDQWLEMVKERNHTLALASLSIEKSNINSWKKVDFSNQCGIENAIDHSTMDILFFSTTGAIYLNKKGKKFNIESCRNEYILIEGLLKLAKKDIQLSISLIVENKEKFIEFIKGSINDFDDSDIKLKKFLHKSLNEIKNELSQSELSQEELDTLLNLNNYNLTNTTNN